MIKKDLLNSIKYFAFAFVIALGIGYVAAAGWTGPTATPPGNNTDAPINVSAADQVKDGGLTIKGPFVLPNVMTAGYQSQLCTDGTTGAVTKCAVDYVVPVLYKTAEVGGINTGYNSAPYAFIDNNLSFAINGITVYNEYWDTSGLFTLAHDGDTITVRDWSSPGSSYPGWSNGNSSIMIKVQEDGNTLECHVDTNQAGSSISFRVRKGHQYLVLTDSSNANWRYYDGNTNSWKSPC